MKILLVQPNELKLAFPSGGVVLMLFTAVSTKVVPRKHKSVRNNADRYPMSRKSLALID